MQEEEVIELIRRADQGKTNPWLAKLSDNKHYYVKGQEALCRGLIIEFICAELGRLLGLPIPSSMIAYLDRTILQYNEDALLNIRKECKNSEFEIDIIEERINKSNKYLKLVKTNKEYQTLQREIDDNKKRKAYMENTLLEQMEEYSKLDTIVSEQKKEFEEMKTQISAEIKAIEKSFKESQKTLKKYDKERSEITTSMPSDILEHFDKISKMHKGLAVVEVKNEICMGCFLNIPPQLYIEVQHSDNLILCPQCSRIIYHIPSN